MASMRFTVRFNRVGFNIPSDMARDLADLSEPFQNIIDAWARHNEEKFERSRGAELTGVEQAPDVFWAPVTERYYRQKHGGTESRRRAKRLSGKTTLPDWLMVRTGSLMESMMRPAAFFQFVSPKTAVFGRPLDGEDARKAAGNWLRRQVAFFDPSDQRMIRANIYDYIKYGPNYLVQKVRHAAVKREEFNLDAAFAATVSGGG